MTSPDRIGGLTREVGRLKVAHERLAGEVRVLAALTPVNDEQLRRDITRLAELVDRLDAQVQALARWRWQLVGAAGGVGLLAAPFGQALLHAIGMH